MNNKFRRIHILGASGSGTSTLGMALSASKNYKFLDTDDYFWKTKYSEINKVEDRVTLIQREIHNCTDWILSGSLCGWGNGFMQHFDLVIFVYLPQEIRMNRLKEREREKYGKDILPGGSRHMEYRAFTEWAGKYDSGGTEIRSKFTHEEWLKTLKCPILRFDGDFSVEQKLRRFDEIAMDGCKPHCESISKQFILQI